VTCQLSTSFIKATHGVLPSCFVYGGSTATVAIMPEVDEVDVQLDMKEVEIKFAR
jgi:hypothetical protein